MFQFLIGNLEINDYKDVLNYFDNNVNVVNYREPVSRNDIEKLYDISSMQIIAKKIRYNRRNRSWTMNVSYNCRNCSYSKLCYIIKCGGNLEEIIEELYKKNDFV